MQEEINKSIEQQKSRRKLLFGLGILSLFPMLKLNFFSSNKKQTAIGCSPAEQLGTTKLLTEDGQLVEVDIAKLNTVKKRISDEELRKWIKR